MTNILSVEEIGEEETCDLEVEHEDHQFYLANGILTSNSHAVAYGFTSYQCAWLMTYYEAEWLCAYSEYMLGDKDKRDRALSEVKEFGYKLEKVDINFSERDWTIGSDGKSFYPGFKTVKGVGESAIQEILDNRPYTSIENFLWDESGEFRHSKFNKKAVSALTSIEAFDSMNLVGKDRLFPNYKAMQWVLCENGDEIKKTSKRDPERPRKTLERLVAECKEIKEWNPEERIKNHVEILGSFGPELVLGESGMKVLYESGIWSIDEFETYGPDVYWFILLNIEYKKTKNGKDYAMLHVTAANGAKKKIVYWDLFTNILDKLEIYSAYMSPIEKIDFFDGMQGKLKNLKKIG